jgi:DNA polymerase-3 subunit delta'
MRELLGQARLIERLGERLTRGEASHAYLLSGPRSIGKHTLALRIAQTLLCTTGRVPGGCGSCLACRKVERGSHPDVRVIEKPADRERISIEQIREMERDLALRPLEGDRRIVVIDDAAELSPDAQHSLLKTLEEPPAHAVLLIVTRTPQGLEETIVSRCQPLALRPIPTERIRGFIAQRTGDEQLALLVAPLAQGRPGAAVLLAGDEAERNRRLAMLDELFALLGMRLIDRFGFAHRAAQEAARDRAALEERLTLWLELLRDACVGAAVTPLHPDRAALTTRLAAAAGTERLARTAALVTRLRDDLDRNSNARTALELLMLELPYAAEFERAA